VAEGPQYGAEVLREAIERLAPTWRELGVAVYGPTSERLFAPAWVRRHGLEGRVEGVGPLDHPGSLAAIAAADLFVRPTLADGDSLSVREALGLGVRVVASDVGRRPVEATLFRAGDPADLCRAIEASWTRPSPSKGSGAVDSSTRLLAAWEGIGLRVEGGVR
jgi:glycosyltransferase involved in cell wall biosynthesis